MMVHPITQTTLLILLPLLSYAKIIKSYTLYHDVGKGWAERGTVRLYQNLTVTYEPLVTQLREENEQLMDLNEISLFRVKALEKGEKYDAVMTSVPFCSVRRANFREDIRFVLGSYKGDLLSISYTPLISPLAPKTCNDLPSIMSKNFTTKVSFETAAAGMVIPNVLPEQKVPPGLVPLKGSTNGKGSQSSMMFQKESVRPENQSFMRRYWYIILPLFLYGLFGGGPELPENAASPNANAPAQRRGKRS